MSVCFFCTPRKCGCGTPTLGWVAKYKYVQGGYSRVRFVDGKRVVRWAPSYVWHRVGDNLGSKCGSPLFSKKRVSAFPMLPAKPCRKCFDAVENPYPRKERNEPLGGAGTQGKA